MRSAFFFFASAVNVAATAIVATRISVRNKCFMCFLIYMVIELFCGSDDTVVSAEVHECEEAEKTVIICIEISVLIRLVL